MGEKQKPRHAAKKPGKSLKQRRAEKHAEKVPAHPSVIPSTTHTH